jgi:fermentation-respiration switch protein FrsA (DUF1100 family)
MPFFLFLFFLFLLYLILKYYEHSKVYRPGDSFVTFPSDYGIEFEDVKFSSQDRVLLNGWFIKGISRRVVLFCHGNFGNISLRMDIIKEMHSLGYNIFIFDYKGFGRSNGIPSEEGLYNDVLGAYNYLKERGYKNTDIILFGRSLGGVVAIFLASLIKDFRGLIVDSSFSSLQDLSYDLFGFKFPRFIISNKFESTKRIKDIKIPKLIIHSENDNFIPFHHGKNLFDMADEPKKFLKIKGFHNSCILDSKDIYIAGIKAFLESLEKL